MSLERTNIAQLDPALIPEPLELISIDLSYLAIAATAPELQSLRIRPRADLIALIKPA